MRTAKYFSAPWCSPCKMFQPIMNEVANEGYSVEFINIDKDGDQATQYNVRSVPTVVIIGSQLAPGRTPSKPQAFPTIF